MILWLAFGVLVLLVAWMLARHAGDIPPERLKNAGKLLGIAGAIAASWAMFRLGQTQIGGFILFLLFFSPFTGKIMAGLRGWQQQQQVPKGRGQGRMSPQQAREILGVEEGATEKEIMAAHKKLIRKNHPDQGGTAYLASQINEARDVLLGRR